MTGLRRHWLRWYWLALHVLLLALILELTQPQITRGMKNWLPGSSSNSEPVVTQHYQDMVVFHLRGDAAVPPGRIVFLGDSLTQGLPVSSVTDLGLNYGIGSDDTVGLMQRVGRYQSVRNAKAIVLAIGVNDLNRRDDQTLIANYARILEALPTQVPVLCSAILPIDEPVREQWQGRSNTRIRGVNVQLQRLCTERGQYFVDAGGPMSNTDGNLLAELHEGDGLHLNAAGNARWGEALKNALIDASLMSLTDP